MLTKSTIQYIHQELHLRKNRNRYQQFIAEGEKISSEILESDIQVKMICATSKWINSYYWPNRLW